MKPCGKCEACKSNAPDECFDPIIGKGESWTRGDFSGQESANDFEFDTATSPGVFSTKRRSDIYWDDWTSKGGNKGSKKLGKNDVYAKCAHSHKPLKLKDGIVIYGGAASSPVKNDHDIYISLDSYSSAPMNAAYPWEPGWKQAIHVVYPITDMSVPTNSKSFKAMVDWIVAQLYAGKSIHGGCMGGHGRTGMLLAAVVKVMTGNEDAITYVRENYCHKAVETDAQARWLKQHFGIKPVKGTKSSGSPLFVSSGTKSNTKPNTAEYFNSTYAKKDDDDIVNTIEPMVSAGNIWGAVAV